MEEGGEKERKGGMLGALMDQRSLKVQELQTKIKECKELIQKEGRLQMAEERNRELREQVQEKSRELCLIEYKGFEFENLERLSV